MNNDKFLSFTYDETKKVRENVFDFCKLFYNKYDLQPYDVIELTINGITYECTVYFALQKINTFGHPDYNYHKIVSKNVTSKS